MRREAPSPFIHSCIERDTLVLLVAKAILGKKWEMTVCLRNETGYTYSRVPFYIYSTRKERRVRRS